VGTGKLKLEKKSYFEFTTGELIALRMQKCKNILGNTAGSGKPLDSDQTMRSGCVSLIAVSGRGFIHFTAPVLNRKLLLFANAQGTKTRAAFFLSACLVWADKAMPVKAVKLRRILYLHFISLLQSEE